MADVRAGDEFLAIMETVGLRKDGDFGVEFGECDGLERRFRQTDNGVAPARMGASRVILSVPIRPHGGIILTASGCCSRRA
jgi:hypothetical protein